MTQTTILCIYLFSNIEIRFRLLANHICAPGIKVRGTRGSRRHTQPYIICTDSRHRPPPRGYAALVYYLY